MIQTLLTKIVGSKNERLLKRLRPDVERREQDTDDEGHNDGASREGHGYLTSVPPLTAATRARFCFAFS